MAAFAATVLFCATNKESYCSNPLMFLDCLQTAQQVQQLEAALQDAQQARKKAEVERDGAVAEKDSAIAECVELTLQSNKWENTVQDLVEENVAFKAETAVSQLSL